MTPWRTLVNAVAAAAAVAIPLAVAVQGQGKPDAPAASEVAAVKANKTGAGPMSIGMQPGGRVPAVNVPLGMLIVSAHGVQPFQVIGGPDWLQSERYDIVAKAPDGAPQFSRENNMAMLRALLAERFKLNARKETREMPIYELKLAREDG